MIPSGDGGSATPDGYDLYTQRETMALIGSLSPTELTRLSAMWNRYNRQLGEINELVTRKLGDLTGESGWNGPGAEVFTKTIASDLNKPLAELGGYSEQVAEQMAPMVQASKDAQQTALTHDIPWDVETQWDVRQNEADQTLLGKVDEVFTGTDEDQVKRQRKEPYRVFDGSQNQRRELPAEYWRGLVERTPERSEPPAIYERTESTVPTKTHQFDELMEKIAINPAGKSRVNTDATASNLELKKFEPEPLSQLQLRDQSNEVILPDDHRTTQPPASSQQPVNSPNHTAGPNPHPSDPSHPNNPGHPNGPGHPDGPTGRDTPGHPGVDGPGNDSRPRTPGTISPADPGELVPGGPDGPRDPSKITPGTVTAGLDAPSISPGSAAISSNLGGPNAVTPNALTGPGGAHLGGLGIGGPKITPNALSGGSLSGGPGSSSLRGGAPGQGAGAVGGQAGQGMGRGSGASFNVGPGGKGMVSPGSVGGLGVGGPGGGAGGAGGSMMGGPMGGGGNRDKKERETRNQYTSWLEEDEETWNDPGHRNRTHTGNL